MRIRAEIQAEQTRQALEEEEYRLWQAQEESHRIFEEDRRQRYVHDMARNVEIHQVSGGSLEDRGTRFLNRAIQEERAFGRLWSRRMTRRPEGNSPRRRRTHAGEDIVYADEDNVGPRRPWIRRTRHI